MVQNKCIWDDFRKSFEQFVVNDIRKSLDAGVEVGTIILTVIGIESLSGYLCGKKSDRETFKKFIQAFMPQYAKYADAIYTCVRNGLAHDYIIKEHNGLRFAFTRNAGEPHLTNPVSDPNCIYINREIFARDFLAAQQDYFNAVTSNPDLYNKAVQRLQTRSFLTVFSFSPIVRFVDDTDDAFDDHPYTGVTGTASRPPY